MRGVFLAFLMIMTVTPAFAQAQNREIILREDAGLTKTEYLLAVGKYTAAIDTANEVLTRHPDNADGYTYRGYAYVHLGQLPKATKDFEKALQIDPAHLGANKYLADIYLQSGNIQRAIEQMQVIRLTCGQLGCEELDELQREIDQYQSGKDKK